MSGGRRMGCSTVVRKIVIAVISRMLVKMCSEKGTCWKPLRRASCIAVLGVRSCLKRKAVISNSKL